MEEVDTKLEVQPDNTEDHGKTVRKRQKNICTHIRNQMEFYFSDSNLHKDRFLMKLINQSEDGYIDLSVFAKFNKLKVITEDMNLVAKALSSSDVIQVSEDKLRLRRKKALGERKDVDTRTVYVECLPAHTNHTWVKTVFAPFGKVVYVSLPRYRSTRDTKGFAFVEFETVEGADKACQLMNNPPASALDKVGGKFPRSNKQMRQLEKQLRTHGAEIESRDPRLARHGKRQRTVSEGAANDTANAANCKLNKRKRARTNSEGADSPECMEYMEKKLFKQEKVDIENELPSDVRSDLGPMVKEPAKTDINSGPPVDPGGNQMSGECKQNVKSGLGTTTEPSEYLQRTSESVQADIKSELSDIVQEGSGDSRKRKHSESDSSTTSESDTEHQIAAVIEQKKVRISEEVLMRSPEQNKTKRKRNQSRKKAEKKQAVQQLRVISKLDWVSLRNEYLQLQKESMKQLKITLREHIREKVGAPLKGQLKHTDIDNTGGTDTPSKEIENNPVGSGQIEYTADVIVKVTAKGTPMNRKDVKEHAAKLACVAYADVKDDALEGFIRCSSAEDATKLTQTSDDMYIYDLIQGEAEKRYWDKLHADRENKLSSKVKAPKRRGRDKIFKKAEKILDAHQRKHVLFEED